MRLSGTLSRAISTSRGLGNQLWDLAGARPSLDLQFSDTKSLVDATTGQNLITFTRASSGTYVDSQGVIRTATTNLLLRSEEFDNANWTTSNASASSNAAQAPNGTNTADKLVEDNTASVAHQILQTVSTVSGIAYTFSVFAKAAERSAIALRLSSTGFGVLVTASFDLTAKTATVVTSGTGTSASITEVGGGWFRCVLTSQAVATGTYGYLVMLENPAGTRSYTGDGTSGIYLWGAQLEQSSTVGEYIPTTSTINSAPRFAHDPITGESLGLLVEEQRTNSIRNNTMVGAVAGTPGTLPTNWSIPSTVNGLTRTIAGVGTINGISYIDVHFVGTATATANLNYLNDSSTTSPALNGQTWTFSTWVSYTKNSGSDPVLRLEIDERDSSGNFLAATQTPITPGQTFVRYSTARTNNNALTAFELAYVQAVYVSGQSYDFTLRIGMPQLELGAFPTSVIPTTTAAATRSADVANSSGSNFSSWYRQDEGTVFVDAQGLGSSVPGSDFQSLATFSDGTNNARLELGYLTASSAYWNIRQAGSSSVELSPSVSSNRRLLASSYSSAIAEISANGATVLSDASVTVPTVNKLDIGGANSAAIKEFHGTIRRLTYWPQRLSNNVLQSITQ